MSFRTVNGSITVELPEGAGAEVRAQTLHGRIETDFPVTVMHVKRRFVGDKLEGTIGKGGLLLELETVNGSIRVRRAGAIQKLAVNQTSRTAKSHQTGIPQRDPSLRYPCAHPIMRSWGPFPAFLARHGGPS